MNNLYCINFKYVIAKQKKEPGKVVRKLIHNYIKDYEKQTHCFLPTTPLYPLLPPYLDDESYGGYSIEPILNKIDKADSLLSDTFTNSPIVLNADQVNIGTYTRFQKIS